MSEKKNPVDYVTEGAGYADITLSRPAKFHGAEQAAVRMREPNVGDLEAFQESKESEPKREIRILANLCECTPDEIRALPARDYARLQAAFALFTN